ncbi:MAG: ABC transporter substrate-binding protein [Chloroflexi bacterium]|nr:ABC transporter substrate-binding protein [Chloroflexota bacterium]
MDERTLVSLVVIGLLAVGCAPSGPGAAPSSLTVQSQAAKPASTPQAETAKASPAAPTATVKAAADQPRYGGILTTICRAAIPNFDTHQTATIGGQFPFASAYNLLVQTDPLDESRIIGDLAKSWQTSPDGLTYTFALNEGVRLHNGSTLTAEDIKFNLDRIVFPPKGMISAREELYRSVQKIEAPDALTVKVALKQPQSSFLRLLALPFNFTFAPEVIKEKGDMKRDVVGTGPFKLQSYMDGVMLKMQKNPDYFVKGRPYLDGMTVYIVVDEMARVAALRTRQAVMLPISSELTAAQIESLQKVAAGLVVVKKVQTATTAVVPNVRVKPWDDIRVRKAVNNLLDREAAAKVVRGGAYYPGYGYVQPGSPFGLPEQELMAMPGFRKPRDQDIAEARKLLAEAGFPGGFKTNLIASSSIHVKEAAEFSKTELGKLGIDASVTILETGAFRDRLFKTTFEASVVADTFSDPEPDLVLGEPYLTNSPKNSGKWSSQKFDELYSQQSRTADPARRREVLLEMQRLIHAEAPRFVITWAGRYAAWWPEFKGWMPGTNVYVNNRFQDAWLAK